MAYEDEKLRMHLKCLLGGPKPTTLMGGIRRGGLDSDMRTTASKGKKERKKYKLC